MQETILKIKDFLQKSSQFYCDLVQRKRRDLEIYGGRFLD